MKKENIRLKKYSFKTKLEAYKRWVDIINVLYDFNLTEREKEVLSAYMYFDNPAMRQLKFFNQEVRKQIRDAINISVTHQSNIIKKLKSVGLLINDGEKDYVNDNLFPPNGDEYSLIIYFSIENE